MRQSAAPWLARAMECHRAGRLAEAERLYGEAIEREPGNPQCWHLLGCLAHQRDEGMAAAARVLEAIRREPGNAAFHCSLGDILAAEGKAREAALCYREALRLDSSLLAAMVNLGNALQQLRLYREACVAYWHAIRQYPDCAEAYNNLGNALKADGRPEEALACYREALRLQPGYGDAAISLAAALLQLDRAAEAERWARRGLARRPDSAAALSNLSAALAAQRRFEEAEALARQALARAPGAAHLYTNLGSVLLHRKSLEEAEAALRRARELDPKCPRTRHALAAALAGQERLEEALGECRELVSERPDFADGWTALGTIQQARGSHAEALRSLDEAVRLQPGHAKARFARALSLLATGCLADGFVEYEWRWEILDGAPRACARAIWDGSPLDGKTILLSAEQGLGDAIHFARYAPLVAARGGRVVLEAPPKLVSLLGTIEGIAEVITPAMPLPDFDEQAPLMSLPRILGTTLESIPGRTPYLRADAGIAARLRDRMGPGGGFRVGLAWAGNPQHRDDRRRSLSVEVLSPLRELEGVEWYSLHVGTNGGAEWMRPILGEEGGLEELAALICQLDLVISVDSMAAHLAGALGRPVWTLLCRAADWRWLEEREDTPWYPDMRLFRQRRRSDWEEVIARVCRRLRAAIQASGRRADKHS